MSTMYTVFSTPNYFGRFCRKTPSILVTILKTQISSFFDISVLVQKRDIVTFAAHLKTTASRTIPQNCPACRWLSSSQCILSEENRLYPYVVLVSRILGIESRKSGYLPRPDWQARATSTAAETFLPQAGETPTAAETFLPQVSRALLCRRAPTLGSTELHLTGRPPPPADWILPPSEDPTPRSVRLLSSPADWAKRPGKRGSKHVPEEERIEQHKLRAGDVKGNQHQRKQEQNDAGDNYEDAVPKAPKQKRNRDNNQEAA